MSRGSITAHMGAVSQGLYDRYAAPRANFVCVQHELAFVAPWLLPSRPRGLAARSSREEEEWTSLSEAAVTLVI